MTDNGLDHWPVGQKLYPSYNKQMRLSRPTSMNYVGL